MTSTCHTSLRTSGKLYRFDRELLFPLPAQEGRAHILDIHTRAWAEPPSAELRAELAAKTVGFCGADLKVPAPLITSCL